MLFVWNNKNNKKDKEGVPLSGAPSLLFEGRLVKVSVYDKKDVVFA